MVETALWPFVLLLPWAALVWYQRDRAVFLLLALLPTYLWRINVAGIPTTWFELALYLTVLVFALRGEFMRGSLKSLPTRVRIGVALWLGAAMIGVLVAPEARLALGIFKGWMVDPLLCVGLLWVVYQRNPGPVQFFNRVIGALLAGAGVTSAWALFSGLAAGLQRFGAWYDSPNVLAMYLVPVAAVALLWLRLVPSEVTTHRAEKWFCYAATMLVLVTIISTGSFGAYVALGLGLALGLWYSRPKLAPLAGWLGRGIFIVGLLLPWVVVSYGQWPFPGHHNTTYQVSSGQVRFVLWREATHLIDQYPLLGIGLGQWQPVFDKTIRPYLSEIKNPGYSIELHYAALFPHNLWLTTWLSLGALGLVALAWVTMLVYRTRRSYLTAVPVALFTTILVQGWFDTPVFKNDLAVLFWLPLLLLVVAEGQTVEVN